MKSALLRSYFVIFSAGLAFSLPVLGQATADMLSKALDLVHQVENPAGAPLPDAKRIDLLTQAIQMSQQAPNHRLKGHRVLAIQAIRTAIAEIRTGDQNHQVAGYLQTADTELSTSVSLARTSEPSAAAVNSTGHEPSIDARNALGETPLLVAAQDGNREMVASLLAKGADVHVRDNSGCTPLMWAAIQGHKDVAEVLLAHGADVNAMSSCGQTPLNSAAMNGHEDVAELLLSKGADIHAKDKAGETPLDWAVVNGRKAMVEFLLAKGADVNAKAHDGSTPLRLAEVHHNYDVATLLRQHGGLEPNGSVGTGASTGTGDASTDPASLQAAARAGDLGKVKALLKNDPGLALHQESDEMTPLTFAAAGNHQDVVEFLLANHADVNFRGFAGQTALWVAAQAGFKDVAEVLLNHGADPNIKDNFGQTPLNVAVEFEHQAVAEMLLAHHADVNAADNNGETPLEQAVTFDKMDLVKLLLAHGADVNAKDKKGDTILYTVVSLRGRDDAAKMLVAHGADVTIKGHDGLTPLQVAIKDDDDNLANVLRRPALAAKDESTAPIDMTAVNAVITRLVSDASQKQPGPVEDDVTEQSARELGDAAKVGAAAFHTPALSIRESLAQEYDKFTLEGPFTLVRSEGPAAIASGKVKMTRVALADWKSNPPSETATWTVNGKEFTDNEIYPMFMGGSQYLEFKVRDDGQVTATFCLLQQHGHWRVHCVALSNDPLKKDDVDFFVQQLIAMANKPDVAAIPSGYSVLHNFGDGTVPDDGVNPRASLYQLPGSDSLYGVTQDENNSNAGTLYKITPQGEETVVHVFKGPLPIGGASGDQASAYPLGLGYGGGLRGVTTGGGQYNSGTLFEISEEGVFKTLVDFGNPAIKDSPRNPSGAVKLSFDGDVYGTSAQGGSANKGTIFKVNPEDVVTTLHDYGDGSVPNDGESPCGSLVWAGGTSYYGTTSKGSDRKGGSISKGTLFKTTTLGAVTVLHHFDDGSIPNDADASGKVGLFVAAEGTPYGTTEFGGDATNGGTFFKFTPDGTITMLHVFDNKVSPDGMTPQPTLEEGPDGSFYGTTAAGGSANEGKIYKVTRQGAVTILHNFGAGNIPHDGIKPAGGLVFGHDGLLYGTTEEGGSAGKGTVFRLKTP